MHHCSAHRTDGANPRPPPYITVYLAEVKAFMRVAAPILRFEHEHHLPRAPLPVKHYILQMSARPL